MTTKLEHTPGPWHVHGRELGEIWATLGPIARTVARAEDDGSEEEANARLIAAAPELLAACQATVPTLQELVRMYVTGPVHEQENVIPRWDAAQAAIDEIQAAIAQAEPPTPTGDTEP